MNNHGVQVSPRGSSVSICNIENGFHPAIAEYIDLLEDCFEGSKILNFAVFVVFLGHLLEKFCFIKFPHPVFLNFYICVVGGTGVSKKDTALKFCEKLFSNFQKLKFLRGISSAEGLLKWMESFPSTVCYLPELSQLFIKGHSEATKNLLPKLCEIFDCPPSVCVPTKKDPILVNEPFLSIIGASTSDGIIKNVKIEDIAEGFINRMLFFIADEEKCIPIPSQPDSKRWTDLQKGLSQIVDFWRNKGSTEFILDGKSEEIYKEFYKTWKKKKLSPSHLSSVIERIPIHILKLAMLYSALDKSEKISDINLARSILIGEEIEKNAISLFKQVFDNRTVELENKILEIIKRNPGINRTGIHRQISGRYSSYEMNKCIEALKKAERIEESGKTFKYIGG